MFSKIRELSKNITVYGLGDVAVSIVNFLLLSVYVKYLTPRDYGVVGILGGLEVIAKIVFRFGLDGSFMRFFYDAGEGAGRRRLASTIFFFLLALNGSVLLALLAGSTVLTDMLIGDRAYVGALRLMLINTFAIGFTFFPFHVLRMEQRTKTFSSFTLARSVLTIAARLVFVIPFGMGVGGLYLADLLVTIVVMTALIPWFAPLIRPMFSVEVLRESLSFGLPRVPHAAAQQVTAVADKFLLKLLLGPILGLEVALKTVGVYSVAVSFGLVEKLFLSAFESAWAPFYYATIREPDAPRVFRTVSTYGVAVLALLTAGVAAVGRDAMMAMTHGRILPPFDPRWHAVSIVIGFTALGVFFQGLYLLSSIGLNITKRTRYYPLATIAAAAVNVGLNVLLIPRIGMVGAGWANGIAYAVQAALGFVLSQRFYRIDYEWGRVARISVAAIVAYSVAIMLPSIHLRVDPHKTIAALPDVLARGTAVVIVFTGLLGVTGFFHTGELAALRALRRKGQRAEAHVRAADSTEMAGDIVATDLVPPDEPDQ